MIKAYVREVVQFCKYYIGKEAGMNLFGRIVATTLFTAVFPILIIVILMFKPEDWEKE